MRFRTTIEQGGKTATGIQVPEAGFEPASPFGQKGLSLQRLPDFATRARGEEGSEVRTREEVARVLEPVLAGHNDCEIARELAIPRGPSGTGEGERRRTSTGSAHVSFQTAGSAKCAAEIH